MVWAGKEGKTHPSHSFCSQACQGMWSGWQTFHGCVRGWGAVVMLWWPHPTCCRYTMWKVWSLQEGQGTLEKNDGWRQGWWEKYEKNQDYFSWRRGAEKETTPIVARLGDLASLLFAYQENEADKLSSTQWFSAPGSVILGLMSTRMKIFMHKAVAVSWLHCNRRKKKKWDRRPNFLTLRVVAIVEANGVLKSQFPEIYQKTIPCYFSGME